MFETREMSSDTQVRRYDDIARGMPWINYSVTCLLRKL